MTKTLKFNKEYYQAIIDGTKTQTLRKSNKRLKENETIRRKKKDLEKEFDDYKEEVDTLKDKYIAVLEEKINLHE